MLKKILKYANGIRAIFGYIALIIVGIIVIKIIMFFGKLYDDKPVTQMVFTPQYRPEPDAEVKYLEKIRYVKMKPEIVYDTVYYDTSRNHLMKMVKADGKHITIQTQYCNEKIGKEFIFGYTPLFQVTPNEEGSIDLIRKRDFLDWYKLYAGYSSTSGPEAETRILFKPLRLEGSLKASFKEIEGKILWKVF